jgi:hypothetical protein
MGWLINSPIYYYFIALIWWFTREPTLFMNFWAIIMTIPVLLGYFIGKKIQDKLTGFILAILMAVNHQMISSSRELLQPHLLLLFATSFIWASISYFRTKQHQLKYLILMILFLLVPLHFHYGVIITFPVGIIFIIYCWWHLNLKEKNLSPTKIFAPIIVFLGAFLSWALLTYRYFPLDQLNFLILNFGKHYESSISAQLQRSVFSINQMIWGYYSPNLTTTISIILLAICILAIFQYKRFSTNVFSQKEFRGVIFLIISMCFSVLLLGFYHRYIADTYLLFVFPFFLVIFSISLRLAITFNHILGWILTITSIFLLITFSSQKIFSNLPPVSYHDQQKEIAQIIYNHFQANNQESTTLSTPSLLIAWYTTIRNMPFDGWGTSGVWYYLEKNFNKPLIKNTNIGLNHAPINTYPKIIYMICDHRVEFSLVQEECINRFLNSYPISKGVLKQIMVGQNLSLWSAEVDDKQSYYLKNVVHRELLVD